MSFTVNIELDDKDLKYFQDEIARAQEVVGEIESPEVVIKAAQELIKKVRDSSSPAFVRERLDKLETLICMVDDQEWAMPEPEKTNALGALAYFTNPKDLIPDDVPSLGFLDDAIMVELVINQMLPEFEAYEEFCDYRRQGDKGVDANRENFLASKRAELHSRMRTRRRERAQIRGSGSIRFSLWNQ